jgi:hypothetical protein
VPPMRRAHEPIRTAVTLVLNPPGAPPQVDPLSPRFRFVLIMSSSVGERGVIDPPAVLGRGDR